MTLGAATLLPGVDIPVTLSLQNSGTASISSATLSVTSAGIGTVTEGVAAVGSVAAGENVTASDDVTLSFSSLATEDGARARFLITPTVSGTPLTSTEFYLTASAPAFNCTATSDGLDDLYNPGESVNLLITLENTGSVAAGAITATLRNLAPASATFVDSVCVIDEIQPGASGSNSADALVITIADTTPIGSIIPIELTAASADGPIASTTINLVVGQVDFSTTIGPDAYGYYCYDSADLDYPGQAPVYDWIEISPTYGGLGEKLTRIGDNQRAQIITIPFTFNYYGNPYTELRIGDNGWVTVDFEYWRDVRNYMMPDFWGCSSLIAAFWDNLYMNPATPERFDGIYTWFDEANNQFIIEWSRLPNFEVATTDDLQTFQIILRDAGGSADDEIIFQYKQIVNDDYTRTYSTVGIEDHTEEVGITYTYSNLYAPGAAPLSPGLAIRFTTEEPVYVPLTASLFTARYSADHPAPPVLGNPDEGVVSLSWELSDNRPIVGLDLYRSLEQDNNWLNEIKINSSALSPAATSYLDQTTDQSNRYRYRLEATNSFDQTRTLGETVYESSFVGGPFVQLSSGSVFNGEAVIQFSPGNSTLDALAIYDATGRRVSNLIARVSPGQTRVSWDGLDDLGHNVPSGLYWIRMSSRSAERQTKLVVIR